MDFSGLDRVSALEPQHEAFVPLTGRLKTHKAEFLSSSPGQFHQCLPFSLRRTKLQILKSPAFGRYLKEQVVVFIHRCLLRRPRSIWRQVREVACLQDLIALQDGIIHG